MAEKKNEQVNVGMRILNEEFADKVMLLLAPRVLPGFSLDKQVVGVEVRISLQWPDSDFASELHIVKTLMDDDRGIVLGERKLLIHYSEEPLVAKAFNEHQSPGRGASAQAVCDNFLFVHKCSFCRGK